MSKLLHYTSFDAALQILLSGKIKFGNIKNCNDRVEIKQLEKLNDDFNYYIFCGSLKKYNAVMWFAYSKNKFGACIQFNLKKRKQLRTLLKIGKEKIDTGEIKYIDPEKDKFDKMGFCKHKVFKDEHEYRFLYVSANPECYATINWEVIESIDLTISNFFDKGLIEALLQNSGLIPVKLNVEIEDRFNW